MKKNALFVLLMFIFSCAHAAVSKCEIFEYIQSSELKNNQSFWEDFGKVNSGDPKELLHLVAKHEGRAPTEVASMLSGIKPASNAALTSVPAVLPRTSVVLSKDAIKGLQTVSPAAQKKLEKLVSLLEEKGASAVKDLKSGNWQIETMQSDKNLWAVRLDGGARATFRYSENRFSINGIGKHIYPH